MTMNTRQAAAFRELIRHEEKSRDKWNLLHANAFQTQQEQVQQKHRLQDHVFQQFYSNQPPYNVNATESLQTNDKSQFKETAAFTLDTRPIQRALINHATATSLYQQSIRIGTPKIVESNDSGPLTVERKVIRQMSVPYTRTLKVPVKTQQILPVQVQKKVKTARLIEVPTTKRVTEEYTEIIQQPAIRGREVWVKKLVPEHYMKNVAVRRQRVIEVPTTELRPVEQYEIVNVTGHRPVEVDGYRLDEVEDTKLVEVEELHKLKLVPQETGHSQIVAARELTTNCPATLHLSRRIGTQILPRDDPRHENIEVDTLPPKYNTASTLDSLHNKNKARPFRPAIFNNSSSSGRFAVNTSISAGNSSWSNRVGVKLSNSDSCVSVVRVVEGSVAQRAGLRTGDCIDYVNHRPVRTLQQLQQLVQQQTGPILLQVTRRGFTKIMITVH